MLRQHLQKYYRLANVSKYLILFSSRKLKFIIIKAKKNCPNAANEAQSGRGLSKAVSSLRFRKQAWTSRSITKAKQPKGQDFVLGLTTTTAGITSSQAKMRFCFQTRCFLLSLSFLGLSWNVTSLHHLKRSLRLRSRGRALLRRPARRKHVSGIVT